MAKKVTVSLVNAANNVLYVGAYDQDPYIRLEFKAVDINPSTGYYCKYNVYVGGKKFGFGDLGEIDFTSQYMSISGHTAMSGVDDASFFASNSVSSDAYCEVITYKGENGTEISREKVSFIAKLHEDVKPTVGDIHFNPADVQIYGENYNILLSDYNRFGIYIGYADSSNIGNLWRPTPGSSIVSYTISGLGIATKIVSTTNGYYKHRVDKVNVLGGISNRRILVYTVTVTDSRGRKNSKTVQYKYLYPYFLPTIHVNNIYRSTEYGTLDENSGTHVSLEFTIQYATVDDYNGCQYIVTKDGTEIASDMLNASYSTLKRTLDLGDTAAHQIAIQAIDGLGHTITYLYNLPGVGRIINIKSNGLGIAFGKKAEGDKQIQIPTGWTFVGATNGGSDKRIKTNISNIDIDIIDTLKPVQYNFTHTEDDKMHYGFIAQDVIGSLESEGFDVNKIALVGQTVLQGEQLYTLAYTEFIPLVVKKCQELQKENNEMRAEIAEIKTMLLAHNSE